MNRANSRYSFLPLDSFVPNGFNVPTAANVILRLNLDQSSPFDSDDSETVADVEAFTCVVMLESISLLRQNQTNYLSLNFFVAVAF